MKKKSGDKNFFGPFYFHLVAFYRVLIRSVKCRMLEIICELVEFSTILSILGNSDLIPNSYIMFEYDI
jgi:hypothetical protein